MAYKNMCRMKKKKFTVRGGERQEGKGRAEPTDGTCGASTIVFKACFAALVAKFISFLNIFPPAHPTLYAPGCCCRCCCYIPLAKGLGGEAPNTPGASRSESNPGR